MNKIANTTLWGKWFLIFASLVLCIGAGTTQAIAAAPYVPIFTTNNNFTMLDPTGATVGGTNDVLFTWDGTLKTAVAVSGQVANATINSACPFSGLTWKAHDVAVYGPGTYTVEASCAAKAPACATGTNPITFTVGPNEIGAHILLDWGTVATNKNIDVVNVWTKSSAFTPDTLWPGACGSNSAGTVWDLMSRDDGTGKNGYPMVDGAFIGNRANFNMMGASTNRVVDTSGNNFTMIDPTGVLTGGTNDVRFTWDGSMKTAVPVSGGIPNATLTSPCPFSGNNWFAHDVTVYAPGTYTVYTDCTGGNAGCGTGTSYTFTVNPNEIGVHMLFNWGSFSSTTACGLTNCDIDVVDVMRPGTFASGVNLASCTPIDPTAPPQSPIPMWTGACGSNADTTIWDYMSYDWDGDCINGAAMVDGPFAGFNANFNVMGNSCTPDCNDNDPCTTDICDHVTGTCSHTGVFCCGKADGIPCNDGNACTTNDTCQSQSCVPGPALNCDDNNACTTDSCNITTGCVHTAKICNDNNACTADSCDSTTGSCVFTPIPNCINSVCTPAPTLITPTDGQGGLGTTMELRWTKCVDPDGDAIKYHITYCITPGTVGCPRVVDVADAGRKNSKSVFYASGAGLLMIGMTFIGGLRGRKKIIALLIVVTMFAGGAFMSCKNTKNVDQGTPLGINEMNTMVSGLTPSTTYYWKVEADDSRGGVVPSNTQSFTTQ